MKQLQQPKSRSRKQGAPADTSALVYARVPPHNVDLEQAVLGACMLDKRVVPDIVQALTPEMFYSEAHQHIFSAICALSARAWNVDILTVVEELKTMGKLDAVGGPYYVTVTTNAVVSVARMEEHCFIIRDKYHKREAIRLGGELVSKGYDDSLYSQDIFSDLSSDIMRVQDSGKGSEDGELTTEGVEMIRDMETGEPGQLLGLDTGMMMLNQQIAGLVEPDLIIIAARPGQGKTAVAKQIAYNLSVLQGVPGNYYSLEMSKRQLMYLMWSCDTGIPHDRIRKKVLTDGEKKILYKSMGKIAWSALHIDDAPALTIQKLRSKAHAAKRKRDIKYLIVDYLQLMSAMDPRASREQQISEISRGLKLLAKELKIPIIALSQLSRECEKRPDRRPQLSDLRESGAIEQDADIVMFLMRPEFYGFMDPIEIGGQDYHPRGLVITIIAKNRHNAPGTFPLQADLSISRVLDYGVEC